MNILFLNCSPKKKGGASAFFSKILRFMLFSKNITTRNVGISRDYKDIFENLESFDAVVLSIPLYVDSIPSHLLHFLKQMEQFCIEKKCKFMLYVISNSGFVGGNQNKAHLEQYKCWCERSGIIWGGGLGIEGGVMLNAVFHIIPIWCIIQFFILLIMNLVSGKNPIDNGMLTGFTHGMIIWLFLCSGMLFYEFIFAWTIRNKKTIKNKHTRVMLPSFVFLIVADIFMIFTALFNGKLIFSLFRKAKKYPAEKEK